MSTVKVKEIHFINHDVLHIETEKPENFSFEPGQATEVAINKPDWKDEKRPFTFTNLPGGTMHKTYDYDVPIYS